MQINMGKKQLYVTLVGDKKNIKFMVFSLII